MKSPLQESFVFPESESITEQEQIAKDILIYLFEPCLKYVFMKQNPEEFQRYAFNTCRQTAALGAYFLRKILKNRYKIKLFESYCKDKLCGEEVFYNHAFAVAIDTKSNRKILLDVSRTVKRLLFHVFYDWNVIYPTIDEYKDFKILNLNEIDLDEALEEENEYITGWSIRYLLDTIVDYMYTILNSSPQDFTNFYCSIYSSFTAFESFVNEKH